MRHLIAFTALALLASPLVQAADAPAHIAAAIAAAERRDKDRERDQRERPAELMAFAGVRPGMKVADVFGGGGYWTELFYRAVGPAGAATLVNNSPYWNFAREDLKTRFDGERLSAITRRTVETCDLKLGREQYDLILMFMAYHDIYWVDEAGGWPAIDTGNFVRQLHAALKPGGVLDVDSLLLEVRDELRGRVVRVEFNLVDGGDDGGGGCGEELLHVLDAKVGDADVADLAG
jgi:predicted methyltransferase